MPWGWLEHLVEMSASCTPNIKLSTKNLRCFYTATATERDVTTVLLCASFCLQDPQVPRSPNLIFVDDNHNNWTSCTWDNSFHLLVQPNLSLSSRTKFCTITAITVGLGNNACLILYHNHKLAATVQQLAAEVAISYSLSLCVCVCVCMIADSEVW